MSRSRLSERRGTGSKGMIQAKTQTGKSCEGAGRTEQLSRARKVDYFADLVYNSFP